MSLQNEGRAPTIVLKLVDLNTVGDVSFQVPFAKYMVRVVTVYDASTTLAASTAQIGLYTAAAAGGTAIVAPAVLTTLTAANITNDRTIATPAVYFTNRTLFLRTTVTNGSAATVSVAFEFECLE